MRAQGLRIIKKFSRKLVDIIEEYEGFSSELEEEFEEIDKAPNV